MMKYEAALSGIRKTGLLGESSSHIRCLMKSIYLCRDDISRGWESIAKSINIRGVCILERGPTPTS